MKNTLGAAFGVQKWISDVLFAINLAKPGSVELGGGLVDADGDLIEISRHHADRWANAWGNNQNQWPALRDLSLRGVWNWLTKLSSFEYGFSDDAVGRAVLALQHLLATLSGG